MDITELSRRVTEAKEMRARCERMRQAAIEDGMIEIADQYTRMIERWNKILEPFERPAHEFKYLVDNND